MPVPAICFAMINPIFQPSMQIIESITNTNPMIVTTAQPHGYTVGAIVSLVIPEICGMQQANTLSGTILSLPAITGTTFALDIDSTFFDAFAIPGPGPDPLNPYPNKFPCAQVIPSGEITTVTDAALVNILP
jgi:hypothetical protein